MNTVEGGDWLKKHADCGAKPIVLLLNSKNIPCAELLSLLEEDPQCAIVAVCLCNDRHWDKRLLNVCSQFLGWPCHEDELAMRLRLTFGDPQVQANDVDETEFLRQFVDFNLLGRSSTFVEALKLIKQFALCEAPVLIEGETGTGKELAARAIHYLSDRRDCPYVPVNCGAIPDNLVENELFGHEKGAFTDAKETQPGLVAEARNGTLFLDEIETLSQKAQITLLRFLDNLEYRPIGSMKTKRANVRLIAATNSQLVQLVEKGRFRRDLFYRLHVLFIKMSPLRERGSDIQLLSEHFIRRYSSQYQQPYKRIHPRSLEWMMRYPWPGNVRELENLVHKAFLLTSGLTVHIAEPKGTAQQVDLSTDQTMTFPDDASFRDLKENVVRAFEERYLSWLMTETRGNISRAAKRAGTQRSALRRLLHKHGIDKNSWCSSPSINPDVTDSA